MSLALPSLGARASSHPGTNQHKYSASSRVAFVTPSGCVASGDCSRFRDSERLEYGYCVVGTEYRRGHHSEAGPNDASAYIATLLCAMQRPLVAGAQRVGVGACVYENQPQTVWCEISARETFLVFEFVRDTTPVIATRPSLCDSQPWCEQEF